MVLPETYIGTDFTRHVRRWLISDTDEDGLKDGEEVRLEVKYSPDGNYATVVGHLISDPTSEDGDDDGLLDGACRYKNGKVVLPKDDKPLEKNKHADVIKNHYENFNSETLSLPIMMKIVHFLM